MNPINRTPRRRHALKSLLESRSHRLLRKISPLPQSRRPAADIVDNELAKLIHAQVLASIRDIYGTSQQRPESRGVFDERQMELRIDEMVASSLMHGRQTSGVLRVLFGLVPGLIGR